MALNPPFGQHPTGEVTKQLFQRLSVLGIPARAGGGHACSLLIAPAESVSDARPAGAIVAPAELLLKLRPVEPMHFLWPDNLWSMLLLPLLPALYLWLLRRRGKPALRLSSLTIVRAATRPQWRRHVPPALVFLALSLLLLALARPTAPVTLPWASSTIMLAIDISRSMRVEDVKPSRMVAAQEAAKAFLSEVPQRMEVGLVTFAGSAQVAQRATFDRPSLVAAIDAVQMQLGTAIGSAIVVCLAELFPDHGIDLGEMTFGPRSQARSLDERAGKEKPPPKQITPVAPGTYGSAAIILLSDGRRTTGVDTLEAAKMAADRGVRIHVVGLGTPDGHAAMGEEMAIYLKLDEPTLRHVAQMTGGEYHRAETAEALRSVYLDLGSRLQMRKLDTELTALLALAAAIVLVVGTGLSLLWFGRVF
ncbi:MAG: VWA domain-containing protein [Rubrivivax sp.]|nr:VWA domain-containing protein [Rubrivivax sp.]